MIRRTIRLAPDLDKAVVSAATNKGFANVTAFMRAAVRAAAREGERTALDEAEQRLSASIDQVREELRAIRQAQVTAFAMLDSFVKVFLTCVPEPAGEVRQQAVAAARVRYERFLRSAGATVNVPGNGARGKAGNHEPN